MTKALAIFFRCLAYIAAALSLFAWLGGFFDIAIGCGMMAFFLLLLSLVRSH